MLQEVRELVRGGFCDRSGGLPRPELPPTSFLEDLEGAGELASKGIVGGAVVDGRDDDEFPANRDDSEALVAHRGAGITPRHRHTGLDEVPDDGQEAFELLRSDRKVPARRQGDERLPRPVARVDARDGFSTRGTAGACLRSTLA